ncbi:MAG: hypothetical protein KQ78_01541 [Candidatus Izimaplasma bacterium HR2]|nr:MAG: hypothetical protein KQ78_01541 [Candidatus Izimaplasma bacterium HR2]
MTKDNIQGIIYVLVSIIIMVILILLENRFYENVLLTYNIRGYVIFQYTMYAIFGLLLGTHNIVRIIKKNGSRNVNYHIIAFSLICFFIGYSSLFGLDFIEHFLYKTNLMLVNFFIKIVFGYSLTLFVQSKEHINP